MARATWHLALLVLCLPLLAHAQTLQRTYDSLDAVVQQRIKNKQIDRTTVMLLNRMAYFGSVRNIHLLRTCAEQALEMARKIGDRGGEGRAYSSLASYRLLEFGLDSLTQTYADSAIALCWKYGSVDDRIASLLLKQQLYRQRAQPFEETRVIDSACALAPKASTIEVRVNAYIFAAWTYNGINLQERVRQHTERFLEILRTTNSAELHAMGAFTAHTMHHDPAQRESFFARAWEIDSIFDLQLNRGSLYVNRAYARLFSGEIVEALQLSEHAVDLAERTGSKGQMMWAYGIAAQCYLANERFADAVRTAQRALILAKEQRHRELTISATTVLSRSYNAQGKYRESTLYYDSLSTLLSEAIDPQVGLRFAAYQVETVEREKAAEIERIDDQRKVLVGGVLFASISAFGLLFLFRRARRARRDADRLLLNVLPPSIATRLKAGETTIADHFDHVTILFLDIANFSQLSASTTPTEIVHLLNEAFTICDTIIAKHGLEKIKTIGDAYMAVCGAPTPNEDHIQRTVRAALEIRDAITSVSIRIGIHTGPAVGGIIGEQKFSYDLWGDAVNIAARLEQTGEIGRIHVSAAVASALDPHQFSVSERGATRLKGIGEITTYWVG